MGAPLRTWVFRVVLALAAAGVAAILAATPDRRGLGAAVLASGAAIWGLLAWRFVPAFDPLGRVRWRLPRRPAPSDRGAPDRRCAITFDDGPGPSTDLVLDILADEGVPATFFVLGSHASRHPDFVRRMHAEGHAVGLHGLTHRKLHGAGADEIERQVSGAVAVVERLGVPPARLYRTPHGFKSAGVFAAARRHGLTVWAWSRGVWDTDRPRPDVLVRRATRCARPGMVLLLHDGRGDDPAPDVSAMLAALPDILRALKRRGFTFVRLDEA